MARAWLDLLAIGDTTTDVFWDLPNVRVLCRLKKRDCLLCIRYGTKVAAPQVTQVDAVGNAANLANGSARFGLRTEIWTIVGDDVNGHAALDVFREEGVGTSTIALDQERGTNYSAVLNVRAERTILVYHEHRTYQFPALPRSRWVYLTSMGRGWEVIIPSLLRYLKRTGARFGFNPGTHQMKSGLKTLKPLLAVTTGFLVNVEEAQRILKTTSRQVPHLLRQLKALGPEYVVITDGRAGAWALADGDTAYWLPIYPDPKPVVERTGCGDSFSTGFLAALATGRSFLEGMQWGAANARMVVQYIGAREGLQTKPEILRTLRAFPRIQPRPRTR